MKAVKILIKAILIAVVLIVVALMALPLWFGPVVKTAANAAVPGVVQTDFHLGHLHLNPYTARFELGDLRLSNPEGYPEKYAVTLGDVIFDAEALSLATDVIHIEEITVKGVFVSYVGGGAENVNNFRQIQYNVAGGRDKYEAAQAEKRRVADLEAQLSRSREPDQPAARAEAEDGKPAKKVVIDRLHISGLKMKLGFMPIAVPVTVELADIGRKSGGATLAEAWGQIVEGVLKAAGVTGEQLQALGGFVGDAAGQAAEAATKAAGQAAEAATKAAGQATDAATKAAGQASAAIGDAAGQATGAASEAVGKAADAVGEGAKKAMDSLKSLW